MQARRKIPSCKANRKRKDQQEHRLKRYLNSWFCISHVLSIDWAESVLLTNCRVQRARAIDSTQVKAAVRGLRLQPIVRRIAVQNAKAKLLYHIAQFQEVLDTLSKFLTIYRQTEKIVGAGLDRALDIFNVI